MRASSTWQISSSFGGSTSNTTAVSDAGLKELAGLKLLQHVYVSTDMKVTENGMRELEKMIPGLRVRLIDPR